VTNAHIKPKRQKEMNNMNRRGLLKGIFAAAMAPAIVGSSILMPVRAIARTPSITDVIGSGGLITNWEKDQILKSLHNGEQNLIPPERKLEIRHHLTQEDLLDARYENAVQEIMLEEDRQFGKLMAQHIHEMSQRKGFVRRFVDRRG
jgi:hypothetical protein